MNYIGINSHGDGPNEVTCRVIIQANINQNHLEDSNVVNAVVELLAENGFDSLENVALPPLGDVELEAALRLSDDCLITIGGISAMETDRLRTREEFDRYVEDLFRRMQPYPAIPSYAAIDCACLCCSRLTIRSKHPVAS